MRLDDLKVRARLRADAEGDRLCLCEVHRAGIVDGRVTLHGVDESRAGGHVVIARRKTVDAKRSGVVGLIPGADGQQPPASVLHADAQHLDSRADRRITGLIEHTAEDRPAPDQGDIARGAWPSPIVIVDAVSKDGAARTSSVMNPVRDTVSL